eukprot:bmy_04336T0
MVAAIYPFAWQHTYIPVLPPAMVDIVCSPTPFLIGLLASSLPLLRELPLEEVLVVDLVNNRFLRQMDDEDSILPRKLQVALEHILEQRNDLASDQDDRSPDCKRGPESSPLNEVVSEAFVRFFVEIVGHYSLFLTAGEREERTLQREAFRKAVSSKSLRRFLEVFMETQTFRGFIQERELRRQDAKGLFEVRAQEYLETLPSGEHSGVNKFLKGLVFGFSFYYAKAKTAVLPCVISPWFILPGSCALEPRGGDGKERPPGAPLGRTGDQCGGEGGSIVATPTDTTDTTPQVSGRESSWGKGWQVVEWSQICAEKEESEQSIKTLGTASSDLCGQRGGSRGCKRRLHSEGRCPARPAAGRQKENSRQHRHVLKAGLRATPRPTHFLHIPLVDSLWVAPGTLQKHTEVTTPRPYPAPAWGSAASLQLPSGYNKQRPGASFPDNGPRSRLTFDQRWAPYLPLLLSSAYNRHPSPPQP